MKINKRHPSVRPSLLPSNATALERAVEQVHARIDQVPVEINKLYDPKRVPQQYLPWMAWQMSTNDWQEFWADSVKRDMLANSYELHAHKGTEWAIRKAFDIQGVTANIKEWYEYGSRPYLFSVYLKTEEQAQQLDENFYYSFFKTIYDKKNCRSWLETLYVSHQTRLPVFTGIGLRQTTKQEIPPFYYLRHRPKMNQFFGIGVVQRIKHADIQASREDRRQRLDIALFRNEGMAIREDIALGRLSGNDIPSQMAQANYFEVPSSLVNRYRYKTEIEVGIGFIQRISTGIQAAPPRGGRVRVRAAQGGGIMIENRKLLGN
jgi:phage tail P2-like protein